jgi:hypothetical protein
MAVATKEMGFENRQSEVATVIQLDSVGVARRKREERKGPETRTLEDVGRSSDLG